MMARSTELSSTARTCGVAPTPPPAAAAATTAPPTTLAIPASLSRNAIDQHKPAAAAAAVFVGAAPPGPGAPLIYTRPRLGAALHRLPTCYGRGTEAIGQEIPVRLCGERIREIFDTAGPRSSESPIRGGAHVPRVRAGARPVTAEGRSSLADNGGAQRRH